MNKPVTAAAPAKAFFVDDDVNFIESLRRSVRSMRGECEMVFCTDPIKALEMIRAEPSAIVVTDWMMLGMDGLAICKELRKDMAENPDLARFVILLTGKQAATDQVTALDSGADDFIVKPFDPQILIARIRVGLRLLAMQASLREANRKLLEMATTDPLTGALNRRQGMNVMMGELARVARGQQDLSIVLVDMDKFKGINDTYGHIVGDVAICKTVDALNASCRRYDSVVRWGGDELLVICPAADATQIVDVADRFRRAIAESCISMNDSACIRITASLGAVTLPKGQSADIAKLIGLADEALYDIKRRGGNAVACTCCGANDEAAPVAGAGADRRESTKE